MSVIGFYKKDGVTHPITTPKENKPSEQMVEPDQQELKKEMEALKNKVLKGEYVDPKLVQEHMKKLDPLALMLALHPYDVDDFLLKLKLGKSAKIPFMKSEPDNEDVYNDDLDEMLDNAYFEQNRIKRLLKYEELGRKIAYESDRLIDSRIFRFLENTAGCLLSNKIPASLKSYYKHLRQVIWSFKNGIVEDAYGLPMNKALARVTTEHNCAIHPVPDDLRAEWLRDHFRLLEKSFQEITGRKEKVLYSIDDPNYTVSKAINDLTALLHRAIEEEIKLMNCKKIKNRIYLLTDDLSKERLKQLLVWDYINRQLHQEGLCATKDYENCLAVVYDNDRVELTVGGTYDHRTTIDLKKDELKYYDRDTPVMEVLAELLRRRGVKCSFSDGLMTCNNLKGNEDWVFAVMGIPTSMDYRILGKYVERGEDSGIGQIRAMEKFLNRNFEYARQNAEQSAEIIASPSTGRSRVYSKNNGDWRTKKGERNVRYRIR